VGNHIIKKTSKANFPFEIIYSDVIGMITKIIYGKKGTYLTFIDEYTRKSWIFLLKKKKKKKKKIPPIIFNFFKHPKTQKP